MEHLKTFIKKPLFWVIAALTLAAAAALALFVIVPAASAPVSKKELYQNYRFEKQIYMNLLSSFLAFDDYVQYYTLAEDKLTITEASGEQRSFDIEYKFSEVSERDYKELFMFDSSGPDISQYRQRHQYTLCEPAEHSPGYTLYLMDNEIWLARVSSGRDGARYIWSIYSIQTYAGVLPESEISSQPSYENANMMISISGTKDGADGFESVYKYDSMYEDDECYNITPQVIKENSDYAIFKYEKSCASFLLYRGDVYALGEWFGGYGVMSMALADLNEDGEPELYFTFSWGSGIHRSHAAYFDPAEKEVVVFDYANWDADMIVTDNGLGGLSLYAAEIVGMDSFVNIEAEAAGRIADILYSNNEIILTKRGVE